jgi:MFS family permease
MGKSDQTLGGVDVGSPLIKQALTYSLADGCLNAALMALADTFGVAAAVKLNAPAMAIALLGSGPLLISSLGQFFLPLFLDPRKTRKHYVVASVRVQAVFIILAGLTGWLHPPYNAFVYVFAFVLYGSSGNLFGGLWISWIRDCVPVSVRGRHFAWRNRFFNIVQLTCALSAGIVSRHYSSQNAPWLLFAVLFFIGGLFRFGSAQCLQAQYDPHPTRLPHKSQVFGFRPSRAFLHFCVSVALLQGATALSGPFFNVWFLRDLKFNYLTFTINTSCMILGTFLFLPLWGRLLDTIGNARTMRMTALMCSLVPIPYLFATSPFAVWLFNFYSGVSWGGFNIANFNYLIRMTEKEKSDHYIAFAAATTAIGTFVFSLLGGFFSTRLPVIFAWQLQSLFAMSSLLRIVVVLVLFRLFKDEKVSAKAKIAERMEMASLP